MVAQLFINGRPAGRVQFTPAGPVISPDAWPALSRLPVAVFPFLDPGQFLRVLQGVTNRDTVVPGLGVLRVEVHP
jgi:hypothetical protein